MKWYVDVDSFPVPARAVLQKRCIKEGHELIFVGRVSIKKTAGDIHKSVVCPPGEGIADKWILDNAVPGDLVFTRDIPLAKELLLKEISVLNDRGQEFDLANIGERLSQRDFMAGLRSLGIATMAGHNYGEKEKKAFADALDRWLARLGS